jgi:hypothetical protein
LIEEVKKSCPHIQKSLHLVFLREAHWESIPGGMGWMQEYWFFVVTDADERTLAYCTCEFMGRYAELMNRLAEEHWGQSWMRYTSFTQRDFDRELHGHLGINVKELPTHRARFDPEEGLRKLGFLREYLQLHETAFVKNEWVRAGDIEDIVTDINTAIGVLQQGMALGEKWFLDVDVE